MIGYLDCSTGVSGDKFLGALLDCGEHDGSFTAGHLNEVLSRMVPEAKLVAEKSLSHEIAATFVRAEDDDRQPARTLRDVLSLIEGAGLPPDVRGRAVQAFELLAAAEAKVHGCAPNDVHFHEVGAVDSLMDVVGACLGMHALGIESLTAGTIAVGDGSVQTSHGRLPVPAPATAELLAGLPTTAGPPRGANAFGELTTPTGAALLRVCVDGFGPWPPMTPAVTGYGAGTNDIGEPNVCRLTLGHPAAPVVLSLEQISVLETNVDHLSGEAIGFAAEQLLREGALDVWASPALMKKGRPAYVLSVLVGTDVAARMAERVVAVTGTLGVRRIDAERFLAAREEAELATAYGPVRFKIGPAGVRAEADDVARLSAERGMSFGSMAAELAEAGSESLAHGDSDTEPKQD